MPSPITSFLSSFVGRKAELRTLEKRFETGARWVTIVGPPGVGKSRLAAEYQAQTDREVISLDCEAYESSLSLALGLAKRCGLRLGRGAKDVWPRLHKKLASVDELLLVLDGLDLEENAAANALSNLLGEAPRMRLLISTRRRLRHPAETLVELEALSESDALQLLRERLGERAEALLQTEATADLLASLGGIPLAIELAAGRLRTIDLKTALRFLDDRLSFLSSPHGERRLDHLLESIWSQLPERTQRVLTQASLFEHAFGFAELEETTGDALTPQDLLDEIDRLCDRSLIQVSQYAGESRYRVFTFIRDLALRAHAEVPEFRRRHAKWLLGVAWLEVDRLRGAESPKAQRALDHLEPSLLALSKSDAPLELRLSAVLALEERSAVIGEHQLGLGRLKELIALKEFETLPLKQQSAAWLGQARVASYGNTADGLRDTESAMTLARSDEEQAAASLRKAEIAMRGGELRKALEALDRCLERATSGSRTWMEAMGMRGFVCGHLGDRKAAYASSREALDAAMQRGDLATEAAIRNNRAALAASRYQIEEAIAEAMRSAEIRRRIEHPRSALPTLANLATFQLEGGDHQAVRETLRVLDRDASKQCWPIFEAIALSIEGMVRIDEDRARDAVDALQAARRTFLRHGASFTSNYEIFLALALLLLGNETTARELATGAAKQLTEQGYLEVAEVALHLAAMAGGEALGENLFDTDALELSRALADFYLQLTPESDPGEKANELRRITAAKAGIIRHSIGHRAQHRVCRNRVDELSGAPRLPHHDPAAFVLTADVQWVRAPWSATIRVGHRSAPRRILQRLLFEYERSGAPVDGASLIEEAWPGERVTPQSAKNRLNVALSQLRGDLPELIERNNHGYFLCPDLEIVWVKDPHQSNS